MALHAEDKDGAGHCLISQLLFALFQALLFVFSILRKVAWDYGRLALVTDADR